MTDFEYPCKLEQKLEKYKQAYGVLKEVNNFYKTIKCSELKRILFEECDNHTNKIIEQEKRLRK